MEKLVYLLHRRDGERVAPGFAARVRDELVPVLRSAGASGIVFTACDLDDAVRAAAPQRLMGRWGTLAGALHFWVDSLDVRGEFEPAMRTMASSISGYLVTESMVQREAGGFADGERRPGVTQLAVLGKSAAVSEDEFYENWQVAHSRLSFRLHPLRVEYVRNAVARVLTPGAAPYRIIVLEHWNELRDFTEEWRYFGSPEVVQEMYAEPPFADVESLISGPTSEYRFR